MPAKKVKDLAVKTGSYTKDGESKNRYENIGSMMKSDDGSFFLMLKRTFNPAGVEVDPGRDSILVSVFDLRDQDAQSGGGHGGSRGGAPQRERPATATTQAAQTMPNSDDIPFVTCYSNY